MLLLSLHLFLKLEYKSFRNLDYRLFLVFYNLISLSISIFFRFFPNLRRCLFYNFSGRWSFLFLNHLAEFLIIHWRTSIRYALFLLDYFLWRNFIQWLCWAQLGLLCFKELWTTSWNNQFLFPMKLVLRRSHKNIGLEVSGLNNRLFRIQNNLLWGVPFDLFHF